MFNCGTTTLLCDLGQVIEPLWTLISSSSWGCIESQMMIWQCTVKGENTLAVPIRCLISSLVCTHWHLKLMLWQIPGKAFKRQVARLSLFWGDFFGGRKESHSLFGVEYLWPLPSCSLSSLVSQSSCSFFEPECSLINTLLGCLLEGSCYDSPGYWGYPFPLNLPFISWPSLFSFSLSSKDHWK